MRAEISPRRILRRSLIVAAVLACAGSTAAQGPPLPFYEGFEPVGGTPWNCSAQDRGGWNWMLNWQSCDHSTAGSECPSDVVLPICSNPNTHSRCWGPFKFESYPDICDGGVVYAGYRSGRQPIADPYWHSIFHEFEPPTGVGTLRASAMQYDPATVVCTCECNCDVDGPKFGYPNGRPNYQAQGWLCLQNEDRSEAFALGVNSYSSWVYLSWYTKLDGWNRTTVPRTNGWRKLDIVVQPYSGSAGDVQFRVNEAIVGLGRRSATGPLPIAVDRVRLGGDPAMITENHLTNTFEQFNYDEVAVTFTLATCDPPRFDSDGDQDVDADDFGILQRCWTGAGDPGGTFRQADCHCMDRNGDSAIDEADLGAFLSCVSGPAVPADPSCGA